MLFLSLLNLGFGPPVLTDGGAPALRLYPTQAQLLGRVANSPKVTAQTALLADARSGVVLFEKNADRPVPPASTTKMMTALLALERGKLSDLVTVPSEALRVGEASMGLHAGEQVTLEELLYGLLLVSGNDAAVTIAIHTAGSVQGFVALMNERAAALGMTATRFANPHGLDEPGHVSSAADLLLLALAALRQPDLARIVATPEALVAGRYLASTNELLTRYVGTDGVKTGTTDEAGQCLVASCTRDSGQALVVVLGSADRYADAAVLLDFYFAQYAWQPLGFAPGRLGFYTGSDGSRMALRAVEEQSVLLSVWQWPLVQRAVWIDVHGLPADHQIVGAVRYTLGQHILAEIPLYSVVRN